MVLQHITYLNNQIFLQHQQVFDMYSHVLLSQTVVSGKEKFHPDSGFVKCIYLAIKWNIFLSRNFAVR